jgi:hypothetical protein
MKNTVTNISMITALALIVTLGLCGCSPQSSPDTELGWDISSGVQYVFEGTLGVHAFQKAVVFTNQAGRSVVIRLKKPSPHQPPIGNISMFYYDHRGQDKACGKPLEGEHFIFDDTYRVHIFEKAIVVWRKRDTAVQSVICERKFRP